MSDVLPLLEETITVAAPPAQVWALVSDLPRLAEWSPQVVKSFQRGSGPIQLSTRFFNINRRGLLVWPTQSKVVRFEPHQEIAFRIKDNFTIWSFTLESTEGGTRITQRREAPDGISDISAKFTRALMGGQQGFAAHLREGMRSTLGRIKAEAER
ncbi:SRPBCC family protein [Nocardioides sp. InS609-2]|uniref:SRPBCC family protein n=1 Tax=Nocardioides sp. InS609-2 TaxID=2760705 RepID=UPI0020C06C95|nr:SRPBCC family protein [Nocardioides sp. InS609-2]